MLIGRRRDRARLIMYDITSTANPLEPQLRDLWWPWLTRVFCMLDCVIILFSSLRQSAECLPHALTRTTA